VVGLEGRRGRAKHVSDRGGSQRARAEPPPADFERGAILFDLDGVLVDSTECIRRNWSEWAVRHGLDPTAVIRAAQGRRTIETVRAVAPQLDPDVELAALASDESRETEGVREVPGARELLATLPAGRWAVVTSAVRAAAELRLRHVGLPVPAVLVAADEVSHGKPHPEGYLVAAAALGTPPADCLVVEDAPAGIEAAQSGGMAVIALATSHPAAALAAADALVPSLSCLRVTVRAGRLVINLQRS